MTPKPSAASRPRLPLVEIVVETDGGPWADHNMPCAVCRSRHAVLNLNNGRFEPCWECQDEGWRTSRFSISLGPVMVMTGGRNG